MKENFYMKLAIDGIRKNKRMYVPYILTGAVMVMMYYILSFLMETPVLEGISGGSVLMTVLPFGCVVVAFFSLLFLFYTNSFLIKQRYREFGLYYVLGMNKQNISRLMLWENIWIAMASIVCGLICGVAFSKGAELILLNLLQMEVNFTLRIAWISLRQTVMIYMGIYLLLMAASMIKVYRSKPLELMQSSSVGEKIPKYNGIFALVGAGLLGGAYYMAVTIEEPVTAMFTFFVAVLMVIVGTYLLFISGSVAFCRMLQKNKSYYYKPNHFVSVSSMVYRMKRNGAGLASICILLTMVLVMLSSTTTLYFGEEGSLKNRYPNGINIKIDYDTIDGILDENLDVLRRQMAEYVPKGTDLTGTRYALTAGLFTEDGIIIDYTHADVIDYDRVGYLFIVSLEDYNRMMQENKTLAEGECLIYSERLATQWDTFTMEYGDTYRVKERLTEFREDGDALAMTMPSVYIVVNDVYAYTQSVFELKNESGYSMMEYQWICGFDCESLETEVQTQEHLYELTSQFVSQDSHLQYFDVQSRENNRYAFFEVYGSLFFLGIMLSIVFLLAAVLLIYYKQISEGYEDQKRFAIMQKVGMTKKDIKKSINSQILTIFFLPLLLAGVHLAFAFPFISKILTMFAFEDMVLNVTVTVGCFSIFGLFYAIVYKITSGGYYAIVSQNN